MMMQRETTSMCDLDDHQQQTERIAGGKTQGVIVVDDQACVKEEVAPPLPPRPSLLHVSGRPMTLATTAVSSIEIQTLTFPDGTRGTFTATDKAAESNKSVGMIGDTTPVSKSDRLSSDMDDNTSLLSFLPTHKANADLASLLDEGLNSQSPAWRLLSSQSVYVNPFESPGFQEADLANFDCELENLASVKDGNEEEVLAQWKAKLKHYLILSSAGKPIYSRHGDQNLINGYIGIIQTIISFYQNAKDPLLGFTSGGTRFVVITQGPLYLMAISRLKESDAQLRSQLEAMYMQILSTLTLPNLTHMFTSRPNTDLRRPLEGTDSLLSSLADTFTKGSTSALLSALECLRVRKTERHVINDILLNTRSEKLLYGLIVAGGRLVSVARPKRHSLHPSDLQLIFNMLFEAGSVRAGGGENWIPLCLPGFNDRGYLYMYVSFLGMSVEGTVNNSDRESNKSREDEIAIVLISADKESFFELRKMRDEVVMQLEKSGSMRIIRTAVSQGRPLTADIAPGSQVRHFIYKSRTNVQFVTPSLLPHFNELVPRRRLMTLYHTLHAAAHTKYNHLKVLHCTNRDNVSLAWITPLFEFYCVAGPNVSRPALAQSANRIIEWVKREEQRIFIIGGAVF